MTDDQVEPTLNIEKNENHSETLPLVVNSKAPPQKKKIVSQRFLQGGLFLLLVGVVFFMGSVIGVYTRPASVDLFIKRVGLSSDDNVKQPETAKPAQPESGHLVVALGKLIPNGDITTVAMPYGAADARIESILVKKGQWVSKGETLAVLDNLSVLQNAVRTTRANVALKKAMLNQTRSTIAVSIKEAKAILERSRITANMAKKNFKRQENLFVQAVISASVLDDASLKMRQTQRDLEKAKATLLRYQSLNINKQPDVQVAQQSLAAVQAELNRAEQDLARSVVTAPMTGTILDIHVRPGEKAGSLGVVDMGDTEHMTAEVEVYQADIANIKVGQHVKLRSDALKMPLQGKISAIGYLVGRQSQLGSDPASNTDARVIKVTVQLDSASSTRAKRFTFLEVVAHIAIKEKL